MTNYSFSIFNDFCSKGIENALKQLIGDSSYIALCVGTDLVIGDCIAPLVGSLLSKSNIFQYVYGTLDNPVTAKEVNVVGKILKKLHPNSKIIAVDAALGDYDDIGTIKICDKGLFPGIGVNKKLLQVGDISVLGVVSDKSIGNKNLFNFTRLNLVYKMAEAISNGIIGLTLSNSKVSTDTNLIYKTISKLA